MTKSTITRERIQRIIRAIDSEAYDEEEIREWLSSDEIMELSRMALAAMESEPVAWTWQHLKQWHVTNDEERVRDLAWDGVKVEPLYRHAQPAPEVPEEMTIETATIIAYGLPTTNIGAIFKAGHDACRAAPQSPGSEPATVPGKWIPVSEQMPEIGDIVLTAMGGVVNVGEMECSAANCRFFTSVISGRELPATHWMPLPDAPQEVKGE